MKRVLALVLALVLAAGVAWMFVRPGADRGPELAAFVERRIQAGDLTGARRALAEPHPGVPPHVTGYLNALLLLVSGKDAEASEAIEAVYAAGPPATDDWRVVSTIFATRVNAHRLPAAWGAVQSYLDRHPQDERALAAAAQYWIQVRTDAPDPDAAAEFLDRIAALPARTVPDDDPTAVRADTLAALRTRIEETRGRRTAAVAAAEERVRQAPDDMLARMDLAEAYRLARQYDRARNAFREVVRRAPSNVLAKKQLVLMLLDGPDRTPELDQLTTDILAREPRGVDARILRARALTRGDENGENVRIDESIAIYRQLLTEQIPPSRRQEVLRNLAVALYDWKQAGRPGDYLDEAQACLTEYVQNGGEIDSRLADVWERLQTRSGGAPGPRK